jgi:microcystin-dependent protein
VVTSLAGSLGNTLYKWSAGYIEQIFLDDSNGVELRDRGYWQVGDIKIHHSYNGAAGPGHGWMLCDGRQITEAAYNTEHGSGTWSTYIGSSALTNKYLPNMTGKYPVGKATTPQDGSVAITGVGNASHQVDLQHTHTATAHVHKWYKRNGTSTSDQSHDSNGSLTDIIDGSAKTASSNGIEVSHAEVGVPTLGTADLYTDSKQPANANSLSTTQSIQPESIEVQYYMRIV